MIQNKERLRPTTQVMSAYTAEDKAVWSLLYQRQMHRLKTLAAADYLKGLETLGFREDEIPSFERLNARLQALTGWQLQVVTCISPAEEFFQLLAQKVFTATCWLRRMEELDYLEEPDMFHDVFGHAPLLSLPAYGDFFAAMGELAGRFAHSEEALTMLQRLYWYTIEFGLLQDGDDLKLYGAGIMSSVGETNHALSNNSEKRAFDVAEMMALDFRTDVVQPIYFVLQSFAQLSGSLPLVETLLRKVAHPQPAPSAPA